MTAISLLDECTQHIFMNGGCHHLAAEIVRQAAPSRRGKLFAVANFCGLAPDASPSFAWLVRNERIDHVIAQIDGIYADASGVYETDRDIVIAHNWPGSHLETYIIPIPRTGLKRLQTQGDWSNAAPQNTPEVAKIVLTAVLERLARRAAQTSADTYDPETRSFTTAGRVVAITAVFDDDASANAHMTQHQDEGVIACVNGQILLARLTDKGVLPALAAFVRHDTDYGAAPFKAVYMRHGTMTSCHFRSIEHARADLTGAGYRVFDAC